MRLCLVLFFSLSVVAQLSKPPSPTPAPPAHENQKKAKPEQQQTPANDQTTQDLVAVISKLATEIATNNQLQSTAINKGESSTKWWSIGNSILITIFTGILALVAVLQWKAMHRQADITLRQVDISEKLALAERAWIIVTIETHESPNLTNSGLYQVCIANYGRTPARIMGARGDQYKLDEQSLEVIQDPQTDILPVMRLLAPQEKWRVQTFGFHASQSGYGQIIPSDQAYVAYITYHTLFDKPGDAPHETRVCYVLQANLDWRVGGPARHHRYS